MLEKIKLAISIRKLVNAINNNFQSIEEKTSEDFEILDSKIDGININLTKQIDEVQQDVNDKYDDLTEDIDDLATIVDDNYNTLDTKIDTTSQTINQRITDVADELQQSIEENVVALQQEDTALQNQINTHSQQITQEISDRQTADNNLQTQITANTTDISDLTQVVQDDYDELKDLIDQEIIDRENVDSELQDQIDNLSARGHYLSTWDATTGLAETNPPQETYTYKSGDYFIVGKVGETNYRPSGTQYTTGVPSTEVETEELAVDDTYIFDGSVWHLQVNHGKTVSFANLAGQPEDNTNLKNALDSKQPVGDYATNIALTQGLATKQNTLVSGTNIKSINNTSILGSGNIEIRGASSFAELEGSPYDNANLKTALDSKTRVIMREW